MAPVHIHYVVWIQIWILSVASDSLTAKNYQLFTQSQMSWNDAKTVCNEIGGRLAMVDNMATHLALQSFFQSNEGSLALHSEAWIGLNKDKGGKSPFRWDRCEALNTSVTFWDVSHGFPRDLDVKLCVAITKEANPTTWRNDDCSNTNLFLCEIDQGACSYKPYLSKSCTGATKTVEIDLPFGVLTNECKQICSERIEADGLVCWAFGVQNFPSKCFLHFDANPEICNELVTSFLTTTWIRSCFNYSINPDIYLPSDNSPIPKINCDVTNDITTTEDGIDPTKTTDTQYFTSQSLDIQYFTTKSLDTSYFTTTVDVLASSAFDTYSSFSISETPSQGVFTSTDYIISETTMDDVVPSTNVNGHSTLATVSSSPHEELESATSISISDVISTTLDTITYESKYCSCWGCIREKNLTEIQDLVKRLIPWLQVDKASLSSTRRKRECASDSRPSAQALGYTGIIIIVFTFSFFVLVDITRFCQMTLDKRWGV